MTRYDLIIKGGVIIDGTGSPPFRGDVGVVGDTISAIGDLSGAQAERYIDVQGLYVTPGFIDIHNHSDLSILEVPTADNYILQGATTIVTGNCGSSPAPVTDVNRDYRDFVRKQWPDIDVWWSSFGDYLEALEKARPSINIAPLVGHGMIRSAAIGYIDRKASDKELEEMKRHIEEAMRSGALGMSSGLIYIPSMFADTRELIELSKVVARYGGIYSTHMRNEGVGLIDSVIEAITIGLESGAPVEISHIKASGRPSWGKVSVALDLISEYTSRGYDISADAYPYEASSTTLTALLPKDIREGSREEVMKKLSDPAVVERLRRGLGGVALEDRYISWHDIMISYSPSHRELEGMRIDKIAEKMGLDPVEAVVKMLLDDGLATRMIVFGMRREDVETAIKHPLVAIGSDGSVTRPGIGKPHPRNYGTFPKVIARYVRENKILSLQEAVRKMTSLPARKLRLWDRGIIRPGFKADLVVFNYYTIEDTATYENPHSYPKGIEYVIVNGEITVERGRLLSNVRAGRILRRVW
ncbi:MAG TPA: D-aminoacylase [Sulfolobales archaeon]|nr:D-aminoacylase [Sulfolobales archaeon]